MRILIAITIIFSIGLNLFLSFKLKLMNTNLDKAIVELAQQRAQKGDAQSLLFLGLRAMIASATVSRNDPQGSIFKNQARSYILRACTLMDNADFWIMVENTGFVAPNEQYEEAGKLMNVVIDGGCDPSLAVSFLSFVDGMEEGAFKHTIGLDLNDTLLALRKAAEFGVKGRPTASLRFASYLFSEDKDTNAIEINNLVSDAITILEKQGSSWNPHAYEYLAEIFREGFDPIVSKDEARALKYSELARLALSQPNQ
jgi:hypothetical protein